MPSPDFSAYVNLSLFDISAEELYDAAIVQMQSDIPDWSQREGNVEVVLLQTWALMVEEAIFAINRTPNGIMEGVLKMYGVQRDLGAAPITTVTFNMAGSVGYTIPAGTNVGVAGSGGDEPVVFQTNSDLTIDVGSNSGTVAATGTEFTSRANGTPAGEEAEVIDSNAYVNSVVLATDVSGGRDVEQDGEYVNRGATYLQRLSDTLVTPNDFRAYALEFPFVGRALALDQFNPAAPSTNTPGYMALALYGSSAPLSSADKAMLTTAIEARKQVNLIFNIVDATVQDIDVTVAVRYFDGFSEAEVTNSINNALEDYLNPDTWAWGGTVRRNELIQVVSNVDGVDYVESLTAPATDVVLTDRYDLPNAGTLSITANPVGL